MTALQLTEFVTTADDGRQVFYSSTQTDLGVELAKTSIDGTGNATAYVVVALGVDQEDHAQIHVQASAFQPDLATVEAAILALEQVGRALSNTASSREATS